MTAQGIWYTVCKTIYFAKIVNCLNYDSPSLGDLSGFWMLSFLILRLADKKALAGWELGRLI